MYPWRQKAASFLYKCGHWLKGDSQRTLLLVVAVPLVLLAALGIRIGFQQVNAQQQKLLKNDLALIASAIQVPLAEALASGDREALSLTLNSLFSIEPVYGVSVFNRHGRRLASIGTAERDLSHSSIPKTIDQTGEMQGVYRRVDGKRVFSHFLPLFGVGGQSEGFLQITRRYDDFKNALWFLTWISWLLWAMLASAIVLVVLAGYRSGIGRHVDRLLAVMNGVSAGFRQQRAEIRGPRDVAQIAGGLNRMLDSLARYEQEIEAHQASERQLLTRLKDQEKMALMGSLARGFAHELGGPLNVISGRAERLSRRAVSQQDRHELAEIHRQVRYLTQTVHQLLDYSRPGAGNFRAYSITEVVGRIDQLFQSNDPCEQPRIQVFMQDHLPVMYGDPERIRLALLAVVRNARQAACKQIDIHVQRRMNTLVIQVDDDGPGLPTDIPVTQLIEPFYTRKASGEGTGLGLSIADGIMNEHGGELILQNREQGGARVILELPVQQEEPNV